MTSTLSATLRTTVIGRWHHHLSNKPPTRRNHWRTRVRYYRAVEQLVTDDPDSELSWRTVVAATGPDGARSTFYEVAGPGARSSMMDALLRADSTDAMQLVLRYRRPGAAAQLLDEVKVWSFWPYRVAFLAALEAGGRAPADALTDAVLAWASDHPRLAAALDWTPPACAVEDLMVVHQGLLPAVRAAGLLSDRLRAAANVRPGRPR
ncbi:hypothetical protein [Cryptosporangium japonicum]|uniref:Uncharacterized protein n=1 Tax=Cryptosporangium japonicum TaxID=80872 RepID=A0ABN0UKU6_9ACTN